ncbi:MAG: DUF4268 domain-containing protein [Caldiserica bacterium]|jgi:hypothetical protein|nr:DUF4268 domain-containing protein [Caldisericota bacterium]MDH7562289.1 DUF4268 domain-containing protein [Caldisericota bacterium]
MNKKLAKLTKVDLREVFENEATDFTPWLAQQENLDLLSEEIGIPIKLIQTEAKVGNFSLDILAQEEISGRKIIIENQLGNTNHDHLGKIITYASGVDAKIIIWIVRENREEHQKAIDWLNEHTDENISFFLIKMELWKIENSPPAPKFEIIVKPNEWARESREGVERAELTDTEIQQRDFWRKFKDFVSKRDEKIRLGKPLPKNWYDVSMGSPEAHVALTINSIKNWLGCEIYIRKNKDLFRFLLERKEEIEKEIGEKAEWIDAPIASAIKIKKEVPNVFDQNEAENYFAWLYQKTILFQRVFGKYLNEFKR